MSLWLRRTWSVSRPSASFDWSACCSSRNACTRRLSSGSSGGQRSYSAVPCIETSKAAYRLWDSILRAAPAGPAEAAHRATQARLGQLLRGADGLVDGSQHHVLEHLYVLRIHSVRVDPDLLDFLRAGDAHGHHPATSAGLDLLGLEGLLCLRHLVLHLLDLAHHLVDVGLLGHGHDSSSSKTSVAPNSFLRRSRSCSSSMEDDDSASSSPSLSS